MIERAGMQPDTADAGFPGVPHRARQQMLSESFPDLLAHDAEVADLDRAGCRLAFELVPAGQRAVARGDVERNFRLTKVRADLRVGPIPPVPPVKRLAHSAIATAVECRLGVRHAFERYI